MKTGSRTPWGIADNVEILAEGIWSVSTPSHGGIKLNAARNKKIPDYMRIDDGWYEEDCNWSIPAVVFPGAFTLQHGDSATMAMDTLKNWHPSSYEQYFKAHS